jgi:uncharacterized membrane protein YkoI
MLNNIYMSNNKDEMLKALQRKKEQKNEIFISKNNAKSKINKSQKGKFENKMHRRKSGTS